MQTMTLQFYHENEYSATFLRLHLWQFQYFRKNVHQNRAPPGGSTLYVFHSAIAVTEYALIPTLLRLKMLYTHFLKYKASIRHF